MCSETQRDKHEQQKLEIKRIQNELANEPTIEELQAMMENRFKEIAAKHEAIKTQMDHTKKHLDRMDTTIKEIDGSISKLTSDVTEIASKL